MEKVDLLVQEAREGPLVLVHLEGHVDLSRRGDQAGQKPVLESLLVLEVLVGQLDLQGPGDRLVLEDPGVRFHPVVLDSLLVPEDLVGRPRLDLH